MDEMRYEPVTDEVNDLCANIRMERFEQLFEANFICVFDNKKKTSDGKIVVARIKKMNDELKFFTMEDNGEKYHYIIFIDKEVWNVLEDNDKTRVITHELYHCEIDFDKKNPYGLRDCEIQTFYQEIEDNREDPQWAERINVVAESIYDPENE